MVQINKDEKCGVCGSTGLECVDAIYYGHPTHKIWCPGEEFEERDIVSQKQDLLYSGLPGSVREELAHEIAGLREHTSIN